MSVAGKRTNPLTVLIVDDSPVDRRLAATILQKENIQTVYAEDGQQGLEMIETCKPDAVLTDLQMPHVDGLSLVRSVRQYHPSLPIILMTGQGSEEIAVEALKTGASSYVPKRNLAQDLAPAIASVLAAVEDRRERETVRHLLQQSEYRYVLGYESGAAKALVNHLQDNLMQMSICDDIGRLRVGTAIVEALMNAIDHGNLELDSKLREKGNVYRELGQQRMRESPYRDRRVHVHAVFTTEEAKIVIRDEGSGFDPSQLPDPRDPENLIRPCGRGVMLIRTFMDEVHFSDCGNEVTLIKRRQSR